MVLEQDNGVEKKMEEKTEWVTSTRPQEGEEETTDERKEANAEMESASYLRRCRTT